MIDLFLLLISLSGIFFGGLLSYIAPEEIKAGEKYFNYARKGLWLVTFSLVGYNLWSEKILMIMFSFLALVLFFLNSRIPKGDYLIQVYYFAEFLILIMVFTGAELNFKPILGTLIFLYGLPTGTLIYYSTNFKYFNPHGKRT